MKSAANVEQLELIPVPRCNYCGPTGWTIERWGRELHKCACPHRTDAWCQAHPQGCDNFTDIRNGPKRFSSQLRELPPGEWEDIFVCQVDESAGLKDTA